MKWHLIYACYLYMESPPSRGAWIEMSVSSGSGSGVAPLAGGVD